MKRIIGSLTGAKHTKWKKPIRKKTAAELLEKDDDGLIELTGPQRQKLIVRAGKQYKSDVLERRKAETVEQYLARIRDVIGKK